MIHEHPRRKSSLPRVAIVLAITSFAMSAVVSTALPLASSAATPFAASNSAIDVVLTPGDDGAYVVHENGTIAAYGSARVLGSAPSLRDDERIAAMVASDGGYVLVTDHGRAFSYGAAVHYGDLSALTLNGSIVDAAGTSDHRGYWMLGSDGGVFSFGSARFSGSTGNIALNRPANGLVPDTDGTGYRFVAEDGGVFAFDAPFLGSMGSTTLNRPVVGMINYGTGYLMVARDGGVFTFSDKPFHGSLGGDPSSTALFGVVSIAAATNGSWYVLARSDGALFPFGAGTPQWLTDALSAAPGNREGTEAIPVGAGAADSSRPTHVIGNGTAASCTSSAVVSAIALGGVITFDCGPDPVTITLDATAKIVNTAGPDIVIDGSGKVTLSGGGRRRILYMNTCDPAQVWTTSHCQDQGHPRLVLQNLTFIDGNATGESIDGGGGGAVFVRGGRVRIVNSRFLGNTCDASGPDVGGGAVRVLSQSQGLPVYVVNSTFGAPGRGNLCSNGGALSSIGVSWTILNSTFTDNRAVGHGANPARVGTTGGGNGGAIYLDGNRMTLLIAGTAIGGNQANEGGGGVFFVSNNRTSTMAITRSSLQSNPSLGFETAGLPGIFFLGAAPPMITASTLD